MQFLKKIVDFYIYSNIHVALAGFCMTKITLLKFGFVENKIPIFVALSIIVSYNFIRFYEIKTAQLSWLKNWFENYYKKLLVLSILSMLGLLYIFFFFKLNLKSLKILIPFLLITFFYVVPLFKFRNTEISFRNFPGVKIFSIAMAWAGISVLFPLAEVDFEFSSGVYIEFVQRILLLIAITIPFDIRDVNYDSKSLKTLPQVLGIKNSKFLCFAFLITVILLAFFKENVSTNELIILIIISIITALFLWFSSPKKSRYYTSFWVEAIPMFWLHLIVLFL